MLESTLSRLKSDLARLEDSELVRRIRELEADYLFKHALVQDTATASLLKHDRKRLHRLVGEALESLYPARRAEFASLLAQHFAYAGEDAKTLEYSTLAGDVAARINANAEALEQYSRALDSAMRLERAGNTIQALFLKRGRVLEKKNDYAAALENYDEMLRLAHAQNDRPLELAALMAAATIHSIPSTLHNVARAQELTDRALELARALQDKEAEAKILWNLMLMHSRVGKGFRLAGVYGEEALKIAREYNLRERLAFVLNDMAPLLVYRGEPERGEQYNLESRAMWVELEDLAMLADNYGYAVMADLTEGKFEQAIADSEQALRISREINNNWNEAFAQTWVGEAYIQCGDIETAERVMLAAIELGASVFPPTLALTRSDLALLYADMGDTARGIELGEQALAVAEQRFPAMRAYSVGALAHAYILAGKLERARELLANPPDIEQHDNNPHYVIETTLACIELALAERDPSALTVATRLVGYLRDAKIRQYLPDALKLRGIALMDPEPEQALANLEQARQLAAEMGAQWSLLQVLPLLARVVEICRSKREADVYREQARTLIHTFAARVPLAFRERFLERANQL